MAACAGSPWGPATKGLMQSPIAPSSDALFNAVVYTNGQPVSQPVTDAQWSALVTHGHNLVTAAAQVADAAPGRAEDGRADWTRWSTDMRAASEAATRAAEARDTAGLLDAGGRLYATCAGCHKRFIPEN